MCVLLGANEGVLGDELLLRLDIPEGAFAEYDLTA